jgi:hypothetical protein
MLRKVVYNYHNFGHYPRPVFYFDHDVSVIGFYPAAETRYIYGAQLSRFLLITKIESSLRNVVF